MIRRFNWLGYAPWVPVMHTDDDEVSDCCVADMTGRCVCECHAVDSVKQWQKWRDEHPQRPAWFEPLD